MEKIVITPNSEGKYIIKLYGTEYEIVLVDKKMLKKDNPHVEVEDTE